MLTQKVESYERDVELVDFVCACLDCTCCSNLPMTGFQSANIAVRDALLEARASRALSRNRRTYPR